MNVSDVKHPAPAELTAYLRDTSLFWEGCWPLQFCAPDVLSLSRCKLVRGTPVQWLSMTPQLAAFNWLLRKQNL
jgi:hypothetical protein